MMPIVDDRAETKFALADSHTHIGIREGSGSLGAESVAETRPLRVTPR